MGIAEIGGKEFEIPDDWTPEQTQEKIFGQFPELDPNRGVVKSGLAKGAKAFSDVATAGSEAVAELIGGPSDFSKTIDIYKERGLIPKEDSERFKQFKQRENARYQKIVQPIKNLNQVRGAYWDQVIEETSPVFDPENKVSSVLKMAASDAIGLGLETPLFVAGGALGGKAASFIPGTGKIATAVRSMITSAGAFGGESALRGKPGEEIAASTATGALVGPAGVLAPRGLKTIAETAALLGAAKLFHGQELNAETWATTLATLVELKLLHKVTGEAMSGGKAIGETIRSMKEKKEVTPEQAEALTKAAFDNKIDEVADRAVKEVLEPATGETVKPEVKVEAGEETIDLGKKDVGDTVFYTTDTGEAIRGIVTNKTIDKFGTVKDYEVELPSGERIRSRPSAIEPTPELVRARQEKQVELDSAKEIQEKAAQTFGKKTNEDKVAELFKEAEIIAEEIASNPYAGEGNAALLGRQQQILTQVADLIGRPEEIDAFKERRAVETERRAEEKGVESEQRNKERRLAIETEKSAEAKAEGKITGKEVKAETAIVPTTVAQKVKFTKDPKGNYLAELGGEQVQIRKSAIGKNWVITAPKTGTDVDAVPTLKAAKLSATEILQAETAKLSEKLPTQKGAIDPSLILPKALRQGALVLNKEIGAVVKLASELNKSRKEKGELDFELENVRFNKFYKNGLALLQIADLNKDLTGLQDYVHWTRSWSNSKRSDMHVSDERVKEWNGLGKEDAKKLADALFEETNNGKRMTPEELERTGMSPEALVLKERIHEDFQNFVKEVEAAFLTDAARTLEGRQLLQAQQAIKADFSILKNKPYFPLMRWGKYALTVRDKQGNVVEFHTRDNILEQNLSWAQLRRDFRPRGFTVSRGYVSDELMAFQGMPSRLVDRLTVDLKLSEEQRDLLDNLQHKMAPSQSWRKHLLSRKGVKGYSEDAMRAYASYFFHGANHLARLKYNDKLLNSIGDVRRRAKDLAKQGLDSREHDRVAEYMDQHYKYIMTPQNELASLRAFGFVYYLGFLPKAAFVNLTQVPLVSYPHLAARFGDAKAVKELARAYTSMSRGVAGRKKSLTADEVKAMDRYLNDGITDESFAATLAGVAEGRTLSRLLPQTKTGRTVTDVAGKGAYLFSMAEQMNRRVTALAAYRLGRASGLDHDAAYVVGRDAVEKTQFEYANWNRPAFMRGKASIVFLFYQFLQNSLYFAARDPGNIRYLAMLFAAAGTQGLPFMEDLIDVVDRAFSTKNKKYDSRKELREFVSELGANPDLLMHGSARYGFGIPWLARQVGIPLPDFDLSASVSMGRPLRVTEPLLNQTGDFSQTFPAAVQNAGGALLSIPIETWKMLSKDEPWSAKRVEGVMPSAVRSISKAYRYLADGEDTTRSGAVIANFDTEKPEDVVGASMQGLGFGQTKVSQKQEELYTMRETVTFYNERRRELLTYMNHAYSSSDQDAIKDSLTAIRKYNKEVPFKLMSISGTDIVQSKVQRDTKALKEGVGLPFGGITNAEVMREYSKAFPKKGE